MNIEKEIAELNNWRKTHSRAIHYCISDPDSAGDDLIKAIEIAEAQQKEIEAWNKKCQSLFQQKDEKDNGIIRLIMENQQLKEKLEIACANLKCFGGLDKSKLTQEDMRFFAEEVLNYLEQLNKK